MAKIIQDDTIQALLSYLATKPYAEVYQVMPTLAQLPTYIEPTTLESTPES